MDLVAGELRVNGGDHNALEAGHLLLEGHRIVSFKLVVHLLQAGCVMERSTGVRFNEEQLPVLVTYCDPLKCPSAPALTS